MLKQSYDPKLTKYVFEMNIWIHALTESFSTPHENDLKSQLCRQGDFVTDSITEGEENSGRMSKGAFKAILESALNANQGIETQLTKIRELGIGDEEVLSKAEELCTKISLILTDFVRSQTAEIRS